MDSNSIFFFDKAIYTKEALIKTSYRFTDEFYVHLSVHDGSYCVLLTPKGNTSVSKEEFKNEILSQMVRSYISEQTKDIRTILMARAFSSSVIEQVEYESTTEILPQEDFFYEDILKDWFETNE